MAIRRIIRTLVYLSWTGSSWKGKAGQGPGVSQETGSRLTGFSFVYKYLLVPSRIDSNKQCFHNQYMHTCLLRATQCIREGPHREKDNTRDGDRHIGKTKKDQKCGIEPLCAVKSPSSTTNLDPTYRPGGPKQGFARPEMPFI